MNDVLTHGEAAEFLRLTPRQLSTAVKKRGVPREKFGREWRYLREHIVAIMRPSRSSVVVDRTPGTPVSVGPVTIEEQDIVARRELPGPCNPMVDPPPRPVHHRGLYAMKGGQR